MITVRPIFVVGSPRSGTGLTRDLLRAHPNLSFPWESHFIPRLYRRLGNPRSDVEARRLTSTILRLSWVRRWGLDLDLTAFESYRSYAEVVAGVFAAWAEKEGKPRWGDKTPQYVTEIPTLLEIFPRAQFIHAIRDGRDVALSWIKAAFGPQNVYVAARQWQELVRAGRRSGAALDADQYLEVKFEALLEDPEGTRRRLLRFLDEPQLTGTVEVNFLERVKPYMLLGSNEPQVPSKTDVDRSNSGKWRRQMSRQDRAIFEAIAGDLLRELDYETEGSQHEISPAEALRWSMHQRLWGSLGKLNSRRIPGWILNEYLLRRRALGSGKASSEAGGGDPNDGN